MTDKEPSFPDRFCEVNFLIFIYLTTHTTHFIYGYMASDI